MSRDLHGIVCVVCACALLLTQGAARSDLEDEPLVSVAATDADLVQVIEKLVEDGGLDVRYEEEDLRDLKVTVNVTEVAASTALKLIAQAANMHLRQEDGRWILSSQGALAPLAAVDRFLANGDYAAAADLLRSLLKEDPSNVDALFASAEVYCAAGLYARYLRRAALAGVRTGGHSARLHVLEASIEKARGNTDQALTLCDRALEADPDCADAYFLRGTIRELAGNTQAAASDWREYLDHEPIGPRAESVRAGAVRIADTLLGDRLDCPVWLPNGSLVCAAPVGSWDTMQFRLFDVATGQSRPLGEPVQEHRRQASCSPDGTKIAYEARVPPENKARIHVMDINSGQITCPSGDLEWTCQPRWHPDAREIMYYHSGSGQLRTVPIGITSSRLQFVPQIGPYYCYPDYSPDGKTVVASYGPPGTYQLCLLDPTDAQAPHEPLTLSDGSQCILPRFSPDGRRIAYLRCEEGDLYSLWILLADGSGEPIELTEALTKDDRVYDLAWAPDRRRIAYRKGSEMRILTLGGLVSDADR